MKNLLPALMVLISGFCLFNACNDPTSIGSDLLDGDSLNLDYTDTLTVISRNVREADSILTFSTAFFDPSSFRLTAHLVGNFNDPIFGRSESSIYSGLTLLGGVIPNFAKGEFQDDVSLDSMVLVLPWDTLGVYGDTIEDYTLEIYELDEILDSEREYFSHETFTTKPDPIAKVENFRPRPRTPVTAVQPTGAESTADTVRNNQLRINLDGFWSSLFFNADTLNFQNDTLFSEFFKGFHIKATSENGGMLSFNLNSTLSGIYVYFKIDTTQTVYQFPTNFNQDRTVKTVNFVHDYSGTIVERSLQDPVNEDSLIFLQGMAGVSATIEVPYVNNFRNILVNKAELELPIIHSDDGGDFDPINQLALEEILDDGTTRPISDLSIAAALGSGSAFTSAFGGIVVNGDRYIINMSNHFQQMVEGSVTNKMRILVLNRAAKASRSILGGASHSNSPVKINLSYTHL